MILSILLLLSGLFISAMAEYYSIMGLMAIFSASPIPIATMGISLGVGKLVMASWVKAYWQKIPPLMRIYGVTSVVILMLITTLGCFGFLSKAHNDQNLVSGDVQSKLVIYDEKIKTARENIEADRKQLKQMDEAVDQVMGRSSDEKGAEKAVSIRKNQARDRNALSKDIEAQQKTISQLNEAAAPIRAENRKVEAEVGPIKYIAAFLYGANPDASLLERAVTWVIILIVIVFDPLAVIMLLASQMTFGWAREEKQQRKESPAPAPSLPVYEPDDGPLTEDQVTQLRDEVNKELPSNDLISKEELFPIDTADFGDCPKCETKLRYASGIGPFCPNFNCDVVDDIVNYSTSHDEDIQEVQEPTEDAPLTDEQTEELKHTVELLRQGIVVDPIESMPLSDDTGEVVVDIEQIEFDFDQEAEEDTHISIIEDDIPQFRIVATEEDVVPQPSIDEEIDEEDVEPFGNELQQHAMRIWKINNPGETYKKYIDLKEEDKIEYLPWNHPDHIERLQLSDRELKQFQLGLEADNEAIAGEVKGFGINYPQNPNKGDMFLRVDSWPSQLYKYNGKQWIPVNKNLSDGYVYDDAYIEHLIEKIDAGEYDPELLSEAEQERIAYHLNMTGTE